MHCFKKKSQFNLEQWWAHAGLPKLILYFSTEHPSRKVARPGAIKILALAKRGVGRGLTYAKIITNKRLYDASAIGSLCVARFPNNIVTTLTLQIVELR